MKTLYINSTTGFYESAPFFPFIENVLFIILFAYSFISAFKANNDELVFKETKNIKLFSIICSLLFSTNIVLKFLKTLKAERISVNSIPKPLLYIEILAGIFAVAFLFIRFFKPVDIRLSLCIPLWHSIYAIDRFISFKQVTTVSDQILETLFLIFATIVWSQYVEYLGNDNPNNKVTFMFGMASLVIGVPLVVAQLLSLFFFENISGPDFASALVILGDCLFINQFIKELNYSQKKL